MVAATRPPSLRTIKGVRTPVIIIRGRRLTTNLSRCYQRELDILREKIANGTAKPCFAVDWMSSKENAEVDDTESVFMFGTLMEAGSDTSRNAIGQAIAAAAIYPEWVKKARAELDSVCGANAERLPTFEDRPSLPYITAAGKETLRWRPFIQAGVPRELIKDDEYKGYTFPAGTVFTWNPWAIALSEKEYENPFEFIPDRFLNDELKDPLKGHWSFGAGMFSTNLQRRSNRCQDDECAQGGTSETSTFGSCLRDCSTASTLSRFL